MPLWLGAWLALSLDEVGIRVGMLAVVTPVVLYAAFFLYYAAFID